MRVAMDEVEDAVRAWTGTVDEIGPGHGALRRHARSQAAESADRTDFLEIGQQTLLHHRRAQARIHAVDADHDHFLAEALGDTTDAA